MTTTMNLTTGTHVYCTDQECGRLAHVVVEPATKHVMEIVVEYGLPFFRHNRVLPFSAIRSVLEDAIHLSIPSNEWPDYPEYHEIEMEELAVTPGIGIQSVGGYADGYRAPTIRHHLRQGIAADRLLLHAGLPIDNAQATIGHYDHLLVNRKRGEITHVAMRRGFLHREYIVVPVDRFTFHAEGAIETALTTEELGALPHYQHPGEDAILIDLEQYLHEEASAFADVHATMEAGVLHLTGQVISRELKYHAGELARTVPGVGEVRNEIQIVGQEMRQFPTTGPTAGSNVKVDVAEGMDEVAAEVTYALSVDQRTKRGTIHVLNDDGVIYLRGYVSNVAERQTAQNIAASQPGVTAVVNELAIHAGQPTVHNSVAA